MKKNKDNDVRIYSKMSLVLLLTILSISMAAMGTSIVIESSSFPSNQWLLILMYTICFDALFLFALLTWYGMSIREIAHELFQWKQYMMIGMLWSMNYVFILLSAPYLSNVIQVVLAQIQSVMIAFIDWRYIGIILTNRKWVCIFLFVALSVLSVVFETQSSDNSIGITVFWSIIFALNSFAGGLAGLATEALLKVKRERRATQLMVQDDESNRFQALKEVLILNFCSNFYGVFFCLLGVPIGLYSLHSPPAGSDVQSAFELIDFNIFTDPYIIYWGFMVLSSFVYTIASGLIQLDQSALYNAICSSFGSCLQLCFFLLPTEFQQPFDKIAFSFALALTAVSAFYIATSDERDMDELMRSVIGVYYSNAICGEKQSFALPGMGVAVYLLVFAGIAGMWLGNVA